MSTSKEKTIKLIREMAAKGYTKTDAINNSGLSHHTIYKYAKLEGIEFSSSQGKKITGEKSKEINKAIEIELQKGDIPLGKKKEIARKFNISSSSVTSRIKNIKCSGLSVSNDNIPLSLLVSESARKIINSSWV